LTPLSFPNASSLYLPRESQTFCTREGRQVAMDSKDNPKMAPLPINPSKLERKAQKSGSLEKTVCLKLELRQIVQL
jgi:hypothetical protein